NQALLWIILFYAIWKAYGMCTGCTTAIMNTTITMTMNTLLPIPEGTHTNSTTIHLIIALIPLALHIIHTRSISITTTNMNMITIMSMNRINSYLKKHETLLLKGSEPICWKIAVKK